MKKITYLIMFLLMLSTGYTQTTSHWGRTFKNAAGVVRSGLNIDLYAAGGAKVYDLAESSSLPGYYYFDTISTGDYDVYINGVKTYSNVWIGTKKLTSIEAKFNSNAELETSGIQTYAVTNPKIADDAITTTKLYNSAVTGGKVLDSTLTKAKMTTAFLNWIDASGGGSITNNPDDETIINVGATKLGVNSAWLDTTGVLWKLYGESDSVGLDNVGGYQHALNNKLKNVYDYGAIGNGTTNDYAAFYSADSAALIGGVINVPEGDFKLSSNLYIANAGKIIGQGIGKTIIRGMFFLDNKKNITIEGIEFREHTPGGSPDIAIWNDQTDSVFIKNCYFYQTRYADKYRLDSLMNYVSIDHSHFWMDDNSTNGVVSVYSRSNNFNVTNCIFKGQDIDGWLKSSNEAGRMYVNNCTFEGAVDEEVWDAYQTKGPVIFTENDFKLSEGSILAWKVGTSGIRQYPFPYQTKFNGNTIEHSNANGTSDNLIILVGVNNLIASVSDTSTKKVYDVTIDDNSWILNDNENIVRVAGCDNVLITKNEFTDISSSSTSMIAIYSACNEHITINSNILNQGHIHFGHTSTPAGQPYDSTTHSIIVTDNQILDPQQASACIYMIYQDSCDLLINDNIFNITSSSTSKTIYLRDGNVHNVTINDNSSRTLNGVSASRNGVYTSNFIYDEYSEKGNSWGELNTDVYGSLYLSNQSAVTLSTSGGTFVWVYKSAAGNLWGYSPSYLNNVTAENDYLIVDLAGKFKIDFSLSVLLSADGWVRLGHSKNSTEYKDYARQHSLATEYGQIRACMFNSFAAGDTIKPIIASSGTITVTPCSGSFTIEKLED